MISLLMKAYVENLFTIQSIKTFQMDAIWENSGRITARQTTETEAAFLNLSMNLSKVQLV